MVKRKKKRTLNQTEKLQNKQLIIFFCVILLFFGTLIGGYLYFQSLNNFNFAGIEFQKGKEGELVFYNGKFPVIYNGDLLKVFNMYLREDPRKNKIPINGNFSLGEEIIISFEPGIEKCELGIVAQSTLAQFLSVFPWVDKVSGAVSNESFAETSGIEFADCSNATATKTVLLVRKSDSESIEEDTNKNCFILNVGECNYIGVSERYIVGVIAQINEEEI